jgi:hypothetical protein
MPQTVTVNAVNDAVDESSHTGLISHHLSSLDLSFGGFPIAEVSVAVIDNHASPLPSPTADNDGDGLSDLLEYVFVTDPGIPNGNPFRVVGVNGGTLTLAFPWRWQAAGISWRIRHGQDLSNIATWPVVAPGATTTTREGDIDRITIAPAVAQPDHGFYVLEVIGN